MLNISNSITSVVGFVTYYLDNCGCIVDFMSGAAEQRDFCSVFRKDCIRIKDWFQKRAGDRAAAAAALTAVNDEETDSDNDVTVTGASAASSASSSAASSASASSAAPLLGSCAVNPVFVRGKEVFGFEVGETLVLHYNPEEADPGFAKFVGKTL